MEKSSSWQSKIAIYLLEAAQAVQNRRGIFPL